MECQWFVWSYLFYTYMKSRLVSDTDPKGDVTIKELDISTILAQVHLFPPKIHTLAHTRIAVDNMAE